MYLYWNIEVETSIFKYVWRHSLLNKILSPSLTFSLVLRPRTEIRAKCRSPHFVSTWNEVEIKSLSAQLVINLTGSSPCLNSHYPNQLGYNSVSKSDFKHYKVSITQHEALHDFFFSPQFLFPLLFFIIIGDLFILQPDPDQKVKF